MRIPLIVRVIPIYMIIGAIIYIPIYQHKLHVVKVAAAQAAAEQQLKVQDSKPKPKVIPKVSGKPVRIVLPSVAIDLQVIDGVYDENKQQWSVADNIANYAVTSPNVNNKTGNTVIYGHYFEWVLGKTRNLKPGDFLYVYDQNGKIYQYEFTGYQQVNPTDTSVLANSTKPIVSLITCEGSWAQFRRVMNFKFVRVG